jgi:uncharacterized repeat protein (TIGR02543 family)
MAFTVVLLSVPQFVYSGTPHSVSGIVTYSEGGSPSSANFTAYIKSRTGETQTQSSAGCGYSGGYYWVQCGNFPTSWNAGDVLHIELNDGAGRSISGEVTLTNDANDPLNLVLPQLPPKSITITTNPSGLAFTVDGTLYSSAQVFSWQVGSSHTISVTSPISGGTGIQYLFASWSDAGVQSHSYIVPGSNQTVTANFTTQYYLTVSSTHGSPTGEAWYNAGASASFGVTTPESGGAGTQYVFTSWLGSGSGSYTGSDASSSVTMNNPITETANWKTQYYLTTRENPDAGGDITPASPGGWYDSGAVVSVDATVNASYQWNGWSGALTGSTKPNSVTMTSAKSLTANFGRTRNYTFTTDPVGRSYKIDGVTYTSQQTFVWGEGSAHTIGGQTTQSGGTGIQYVLYSIQDNSGNEFLPGGSLPPEALVSFPVGTSDKTITGKFRMQYQLTVTSAYGSPTGQGWYNAGSTANFGVTTPASGGAGTQYVFTGWTGSGSGSYIGSNASSSVTMNNPITETASWKTQYQLTVTSARGTPSGSGWYDAGGTANFSVTPTTVSGGTGTQYVYTSWTGTGSGSYTGSVVSSSVTMNNPITETASWKTQYYLTTSENPDAGGNITPAPPGGWYDSGAAVGVDATVNGGYQWAGWTGNLTGTTKPTTVTMSSPKTVTANFANIQITIATNPAGRTIVVDGISYTSPQTFAWVVNSSHPISVGSPQSGGAGMQYLFTAWSNGGGRSQNYTVPASNQTVTATFKTQYYLTVNSSHGNPQGSGWFDAGANGNFSVSSPDIQGGNRYVFLNWSGDASGASTSGSVVMNSAKNVNANWKTQYYLTVVSSHGNPQGAGWYESGATANFSVTTQDIQNTTRYIFQNWSGDFTGSIPAGSTPMANAKTVTAYWNTQFLLTTHENPDEGGNMIPVPSGGWFDQGTVVSCSAQPDTNFVFSNWSGGLTGLDNTMDLTMDGPKDVTANFSPKGKVLINSNPPGLSLNVDGIAYIMPHYFTWDPASSHTISVADTMQNGASGIRYLFLNWSDGGDRTHSIVLNGTAIFTVNFKAQYYLETLSNPPEGGSIGLIPGGHWYDVETTVNVSAFQNEEMGYRFESWSGSLSGTSNMTSIFMDAPKSITASFTLMTFHLTTVVDPPSAGIIHCLPEKSEYVFGEKIKITSEMLPGYYFGGWAVDGVDTSVTDTLVLVMKKDRTIRLKSGVTAVDDKKMVDIPTIYQLSQNYPNPFNPSTAIKYQIPKEGNVTIEIYNNMGQKLRTLIDEFKKEGSYEAIWDGRKDNGETVGSGLYLYMMRSGGYVKIMKAAFIR